MHLSINCCIEQLLIICCHSITDAWISQSLELSLTSNGFDKALPQYQRSHLMHHYTLLCIASILPDIYMHLQSHHGVAARHVPTAKHICLSGWSQHRVISAFSLVSYSQVLSRPVAFWTVTRRNDKKKCCRYQKSEIAGIWFFSLKSTKSGAIKEAYTAASTDTNVFLSDV